MTQIPIRFRFRFRFGFRRGVTSLCLEAGVGVRRRVLLRNIRRAESAAKVLGVFLVVADVGMGVVDVVGVETRVPVAAHAKGRHAERLGEAGAGIVEEEYLAVVRGEEDVRAGA